jgi:raffinose/stachyose/melibiose transport system substrate-binding protein
MPLTRFELARRVLKVAALVAAVALYAVAYASGGAEGDDSGGKSTLTLSWQIGGEPGVQPLIKGFEHTHPGVKVKVTYYPVPTYAQTIQTRFQGGAGPDLVFGAPGNGGLTGLGILQDQGRLYDLAREPYATSIPRDALLWRRGTLYGIPLGAVPLGFVYNIKALADDGITPPKSFPELLATCKRRAADGKALVDIAVQNVAGGSLIAGALAGQFVYAKDPAWNDKRNAGKVTFAGSPLWRDVFAKYLDMKSAGCYPKAAAGTSLAQAIGLLVTGDAPMTILPADGAISLKTVVEGVEFGFAAFPGDTAQSTVLPVAFGQAIGLNNSSKHLSAARDFMAYAAQPAQQKLLANGLGVPSVAQVQNGQGVTPVLRGVASLIKQRRTSQDGTLTFPNPGIMTALANGLTSTLTGQKSVDDVLGELDKAWEKSR